MSPQELDILLKSDKSNWYTTNEKGIRVWDISKVTYFWESIKIHKIQKGDYLFKDIVFPTCSIIEDIKLEPNDNFYTNLFGSQTNAINTKVSFINCTFQGNTIFLGKLTEIDSNSRKEIIFAKELIFSNCKFEQEFRLSAIKVLGNLRILKCEFQEEFSMLLSIFNSSSMIGDSRFNGKFIYFANTHNDKTNFGNNVHSSKSEFGQSIFNENISINGCKFNNTAKFYSNTYNKNGEINSIEFNGKSSHIHEKYSSHRFSRISFSQTNHTFQNIVLKSQKKLTFQNVIFNDSISFYKCDCNSILFKESDINDLNFSSCNWDTNYRLLMKDELENKDYNIENYKNLEKLYRQLKKIFEGNKDWELSGKAYVSEMYIRKKRLWKEHKYLSWLIFSFYDFFGGFTQDYIKPLKWYFFFTFIFFPIYYLNFDCSQKPLLIFKLSFCDLEQAFQKSVASSFPFLNTNLVYENWWIKALQTFICGIMLTFFILALRKRFKQ